MTSTLPIESILVAPLDRRSLGDVRAILAHYIAESVAHLGDAPPEMVELEEKFDALHRLDLPFLALYQGDNLRGFACVSQFRPRTGYRHSYEVSIYLAPGHCGQGYGSQLMAGLLARCDADSRIRQLIAVVSHESGLPLDRSASIALHRKHGFRVIGTFVEGGIKFDRFVDVIFLQRSTLPADTSAGETIP